MKAWKVNVENWSYLNSDKNFKLIILDLYSTKTNFKKNIDNVKPNKVKLYF